jgi:hypothetical protein
MISTFTAVFDANVFYGARPRSLMLYLAGTKMFRARWSAHIHDEWIRNLVAKRPDLSVERLDRSRHLMDRAVPDCLVTGYTSLIPSIILPDLDDRHVVAAAIRASANCIVTFNLSDFPEKMLAPLGLHARHPDDFLLDVQGIDPIAFAGAVREDFLHYQHPPLVFAEYVASLIKAGVPKTAAEIDKLKIIILGEDEAPNFIDLTPS